MKRVAHYCCILLSLLILGGCEENSSAVTRDIIINMDSKCTTTSRNINPDGDAPMDVVSYSLSGTGPAEYSFGPIESSASSFTLHSVPIGQWIFEAIGYNGENQGIASGSLETQITHNSDALTIELDELIGDGDLSLTVTWDPDQTYSDVAISVILKDVGGTVAAQLSETKQTGDSSAVFAMEDIAAGFYRMEIAMASGTEKLASIIDTLLIIDGTISSATVELVSGVLADNNSFIIIDKTAKPIEGTVTTDTEEPTVGGQVTLTYSPTLPSGVKEDQLSVQWYCDGEPILGAEDPIHVITAALGGTHRYDVVVSIAAIGSVGSAFILVNAPVTPWIE